MQGRNAHAPKAPVAIHKIKHVIVIMQENRSFDQYFGTYPGRTVLPRETNRRLRSDAFPIR